MLAYAFGALRRTIQEVIALIHRDVKVKRIQLAWQTESGRVLRCQLLPYTCVSRMLFDAKGICTLDAEVAENRALEIFERRLIKVIDLADSTRISGIHEVYRFKVHHPVSEALHLRHQLFLPLLDALTRIVGSAALQVDDLHEENEDVLELFRHH